MKVNKDAVTIFHIHTKIGKVIQSCVNKEQLEVAWNMVIAFRRLYDGACYDSYKGLKACYNLQKFSIERGLINAAS